MNEIRLLKGCWLFSLPTVDITFGTRMMKSRILYVLLFCILSLLVFQAHTRVFAGRQKFPSYKSVVSVVDNQPSSSIHTGRHEPIVMSDFLLAESNDDDESTPSRKKATNPHSYTTVDNIPIGFSHQSFNKPGGDSHLSYHPHDKYIFQRTLRV